MSKDGEKLELPVLTKWRNGTLTGAYYYYSDKFKRSEVKLVGNWENEGHGYWFAPWKAIVALAAAGLIKQKANLERFEFTANQRMGIYRVKVADSKAHEWKAFALEENGDAVTLTAVKVEDPRPADGNGTAPTSAPAAPGTAPAAPGAPTSESAPGAEPTSGPPPGDEPPKNRQLTPEEQKARDTQIIAETAELYATAHAIAATVQVSTFRRPTIQISDEAIQRGAATVLIALTDKGARVHPNQAKALRKVLHEVEDEVNEDNRRRTEEQ